MNQYHVWSSLVSLATLVALEAILGIDNLVFISIITGKLPSAEQPKARKLGLAFAVITRIGLLLSLKAVMRLTKPLFTVMSFHPSGKDLILLVGGLFLIGKSTYEIYDKLEANDEDHLSTSSTQKKVSLISCIVQIIILDIIFSLDSVITAIGMAQELWVMIAAVLLATGLMLLASGWISKLIKRHPSLKMLALSFLILIGVMLMMDGFGKHIERGYLYFAMAFSLAVEALNILLRRKAKPVQLRHAELPKVSTSSIS